MKYLLLALLSLPALAIPEKDYMEVWKRDILTTLDSVPAQEFENKQGLKVRFRTYHRGHGLPNIVISPGQGEPAKKYFEFVHDFPKANIYLIDHQGQGESERALKDPQKDYVKSFSHYVDDFTFWMENHVLPETRGEKLFLVAHSMGAAISTRFMETHPDVFDAVAFSAPMYDVYTNPYPGSVARVLAKTLMLAGRAKNYAPGKGRYNPEEDVVGKNKFSHSPDRIAMNKYLFTEQNLAIGGVTVSWVHSAFKGMNGIENVGMKLKMPILLLQATEDQTVKPQKQLSFCMAAKNCELVKMMGAYHEILQETDVIRDLALKLIKDHFAR